MMVIKINESQNSDFLKANLECEIEPEFILVDPV